MSDEPAETSAMRAKIAPPLARGRAARRDGGSGRLSTARLVPLYYQLAVILQSRLDARTYPVGGRFPSERELCEEFEVSRAVVRPAMAILEHEGKVERVKGKGTFVRAPKATLPLGGLTRLVAAGSPAGATLEVVERRLESAPAPGQRPFVPVGGGPLVNVSAVVRADGEPLALVSSFLDAEKVGWAEALPAEGAVSISELSGDVVVAEGTLVVETSAATEFEAYHLRLAGGTPILVASCTESTLVPGGRVASMVEAAWLVCRADAMRVSARQGAAGGPRDASQVSKAPATAAPG